VNPIDLRRPAAEGAVAETATTAPVVEPREAIRAARIRPTVVRRVFEWPLLRPGLDLLALIGAVVLALRWPGEPVALADGWPLLPFPVVAMALLAARGMYSPGLRPTVLDGVVPIVGSISVAAMAAVVLGIYTVGPEAVTSPAAHMWGAAVAFVGFERVGLLMAQRIARARGLDGRPTLIVGAGQVGARIARRLVQEPQYGLRPVGFLDADPLAGDKVPGVPVLGSPDELDWVAQLTGAEHVVIAFSSDPDERLVDLVRRCEALGLEVSLVPRLFESLNQRAIYEPLGGTPLVKLNYVRPRSWQFAIKHALDRVLAAILLVIAAPLMLLIALAVKLSSPGPVLFRQRRVGRDGTVFDLLKFRSMRIAPEAEKGGTSFRPGEDTAPGGIEGDDRRTAVGRFLRRTSLDELPQLINVLRGEMSLVGPRPERPEFVELFESDIKRYGDRHRVKSGVTGWAQVHGLRGQTSLSDRVEWDNYYIEHWSLGLDLKILALTAIAVFRPAED